MLEGAWLWGVKDGIDRAFMRKYSDDLADMTGKMMAAAAAKGGGGASHVALPPDVYSAAGAEALTVFAESKMRCGGCGAKVWTTGEGRGEGEEGFLIGLLPGAWKGCGSWRGRGVSKDTSPSL